MDIPQRAQEVVQEIFGPDTRLQEAGGRVQLVKGREALGYLDAGLLDDEEELREELLSRTWVPSSRSP